MAQRRVQNHRKGNKSLGAESDELSTAKVSRLKAQIDSMHLLIMETKIESLEKQNAGINLQNASINLQNASINRQIIKLGKKYGFGCARLLEGYSVAMHETAAYPGIRTPENLSPS